MNRKVLAVFAPVLVAVGVAGFVVPADKARTSGAPPYNVFHLVAGAIGLAIVVRGDEEAARRFNIGFGLVDLYQAVASRAGWFPKSLFRWTPADDTAHVVIGAALVGIGVWGLRSRRSGLGRSHRA